MSAPNFVLVGSPRPRPVDGTVIVRLATEWRTLIRKALAKDVMTEADTEAAHAAYAALVEAIDTRIPE